MGKIRDIREGLHDSHLLNILHLLLHTFIAGTWHIRKRTCRNNKSKVERVAVRNFDDNILVAFRTDILLSFGVSCAKWASVGISDYELSTVIEIHSSLLILPLSLGLAFTFYTWPRNPFKMFSKVPNKCP